MDKDCDKTPEELVKTHRGLKGLPPNRKQRRQKGSNAAPMTKAQAEATT